MTMKNVHNYFSLIVIKNPFGLANKGTFYLFIFMKIQIESIYVDTCSDRVPSYVTIDAGEDR